MVINPIYNQGPAPLYDTIPTTVSGTLKDSERNGASTFSGFKTSSSTFKGANAYYMNESPYLPSQTNSSGNDIHAPNVSFHHEDGAANDSVTIPSLECVEKFVANTDNGEETYVVMLPSSAGANSKP